MNRSTARMLDANFNRAREGARVVEDYARFILDHPSLSKECKAVRHELQSLARCAERALGAPLSSFRDTPGDVGTRISHRSESKRAGRADVLRANLKRLQESLRVLEEYGKWLGGATHARFERLRYRVYTLEQRMERGVLRQNLFARAWLVVELLERECGGRRLDRLGVFAGVQGVRGCVLRLGGGGRAALRIAALLRALFPPGRGLLLVVDDAALALRAHADGVIWEVRKPSMTVLAQLESAGIRSGGAGKIPALLKKRGCRPFVVREAGGNSMKIKAQGDPFVWTVKADEFFSANETNHAVKKQKGRGLVRRKDRSQPS